MSSKFGNHHETREWTSAEDLLRAIPEVLFARKWVILGALLLTFSATAAATFIMSPVYVASASILVKKERFDAAVTPEQVIATGQPDRHLTEEELNSEVEILSSASLHEQVIRKLHLDQPAQPGLISELIGKLSPRTDDPRLTRLANAITRFEANLNIEAGKKSNLIKITFKDNDRQRAADVVNALCQAYQERHISLRQSDSTSNFFSEQAQEMKRDLDQKEAALRSVTPLPSEQLLNQQIDTQIRQLSEFEVALQNTRAAVAESQARIAALKDQLSREPERLTGEERVSHRSAPEAVRAQLFALELKRSDMATKYRPDHRLVQDLDKEIEKARQMVAQLEKSPAESMTSTTLNPVHQRLRENLNAEQGNLDSLREKEKMLQASTSKASEKINDLGQRGYEQRRLDRERDLADHAYQLYAKKGEESRISKALDKQGIVNIQVAEPARAPFQAASPNIPLNLILGFVGGLIVGLACAATLEFIRPTVKQRPFVNSQPAYLTAVPAMHGKH